MAAGNNATDHGRQIVAGVPNFDNGEFTGRYPGLFIGPELVEQNSMAIAAE